jgi:hypothetical protein
LYPNSPDPVTDWRSLVLLWQSQLPATGWSGLLEQMEVVRAWREGRREVRLAWVPEMNLPLRIDSYWAYGYRHGDAVRPKHPGESLFWRELNMREALLEHQWHCDPGDDVILHAIEPLYTHVSLEVAVTYFNWYESPDGAVSAANALVNLWLAVSQDSEPERLAASFDKCLPFTTHGFRSCPSNDQRRFGEIVLRQLAMNPMPCRRA